MTRFVSHRLLAVGAAAAALLTVAPAASAMDEILLTVPVTGVHRGAEGTSVRVASVDVPVELVGQSCEIFGSTVNQRSVHPGNDLLIVNGDESFTIPDFEDEGDIVHDAGDVETLGATIQVFVRFGPDAVSSGGFRVTVRNCGAAVPETTVPVSTTESIESTTLTTPAESTTTPSTPDSTDPAGPTETSTTTTTEAPATTTTEAPATTTTEAPDASVAPDPLGPTATDTLPATGSSTWLIVSAGLALAALGGVLTRTSRPTVE